MSFFDKFKKKGNTPLQGAPTDNSADDQQEEKKAKQSEVGQDKAAEPKQEKKKEKLADKVQKKRDELKEKQTELKKGKKKEKTEEKRKLADTKDAHRVLLQPIITEKATVTGTYVFEVHSNTNKNEVKKAIFRVYGVTPQHVRIINVKGKSVRWGQQSGSQKSWKKAIVRLPEGEVINVYEGT